MPPYGLLLGAASHLEHDIEHDIEHMHTQQMHCRQMEATTVMPDEASVVSALRRRDEAAFAMVVKQHHGALVRAARSFVNSPSAAEEVAQDTWIAVIGGIDAFEGRSSFKTWLFRILVNQARARGVRDGRLRADHVDETGVVHLSVPADRFQGPDQRWPGHWQDVPADWSSLPEHLVDSAETRSVIEAAIATLPDRQCQVITLRDIDGLGAREVCEMLELTEANERVLLHRARAQVRAALETHLDEVAAS